MTNVKTISEETNTPAIAAIGCPGTCPCAGSCLCGKRTVDMADLRIYPTEFPVTDAVEIDGNAIQVTWKDGATDNFHFAWLRENDPHPVSRHPQSRERLVRPVDVPLDIRPARISVHQSGALLVRWSKADGGHQSLFDAGWLRAHRYGHIEQTTTDRAPRPARNRPNRPRPVEAVWSEVINDDDALLSWLHGYLAQGWSVISETPSEEGQALVFGERIGTVRASNFGFCFNVRSKANPNSNAYTANYLSLHTDLPHYEMPPGLQILHCLVNSAEGGASILSDGLAVAEFLRRSEPETFKILSETRLAFRFQDDKSEFNARHPIIECDASGDPIYVNWSNSTLAPLDVPFEQMQAVQAAIRRFVVLIESPRFLIERKLQAGEMLVFDNRRMLHGRTAFQPETGDRHFQGCYLETAEVLSRRNALARRDPSADLI